MSGFIINSFQLILFHHCNYLISLYQWHRRQFRKSENSRLLLSCDQRPYSFLNLFPRTKRVGFSPRITTMILLLEVLQSSLDDVLSHGELHTQEQNFIPITEFFQALLCLASDTSPSSPHPPVSLFCSP